MTVIAELAVPASEFVLGKALREAPDLAVEVEKVVPAGRGIIPYFWVIGDDPSAFEAVLEREPELAAFAAVDRLDSRTLYRAEWDASADTFVQAVVDADAALQEAQGDAERWTFQLRFHDAAALSAFHTACREAGIEVTVERLFNPVDPTVADDYGMTEAQRSLVELAYDRGYFDVPRRITLVELAEELGISDQSVNERLRRGLSGLVEAMLKPGS